MRPRLKLLRLKGSDVLENLSLEEKILRHNKDNWCICSSGPLKATIVLGMSAKVEKLVDIHAVARDRVQMIRRFSGGGTVIVDNSTVFITFIMNSPDISTQPYPRDIMKWTEDFYSPVFKTLKATRKFTLRENDYVFDDLKFGGNAQNITKNRWLHHTSFLWDYKPSNMQYLLMPEKKPEYRLNRDHSSFITPMIKYLPEGVRMIDFFDTIFQHLHGKFDISVVGQENIAEVIDVNSITSTSVRSVEEPISKYILGSCLPQGLSTTAAAIAVSKTSAFSSHSSSIPSLVAIGPSCGVNH